jgi:hypothetical protein
MADFLGILSWFLISTVKFVVSVGALLSFSSRPWYFDMLIVMSGGITGVIVFTYLGAIISKKLSKYHFFKIKYKTIRKLIKLKNGYGLMGIAFITPVVISIPVGCIFSASIEHNKLRVIRIQAMSVIIWSAVLFGLKGLFNVQIVP